MIIGLTGYSGAGKDAVASYLVGNYDYKRLAFADPLRKFLYEFNPKIKTRESRVLGLQEIIDAEGWPNAQRVHPEVRQLLQRFATDFVRDKVDPNFWVKLTMYDIVGSKNYVISDVRFANEAQAIIDRGGILVKVDSDRAALNQMSHASEQQEIPHDIVLDNNGTLDDLYVEINRLMATV